MATTPPPLGQPLHTVDDVKQAVEDWSIADKFAFRMQLKDKDRADYRCKFSTICQARVVENVVNCPWRVFASRTQTGDIIISCLSSQHDCLGAVLPIRSTCYNQSWLTRQIPKHIVVSTTRKTTPCELIDSIQLHYNQEVSYHAAYKACSTVSNNTIEYEYDSYRQIPAYLARVQAANPWAYLRLDTLPTIELDPLTREQLAQFRHVSVCPVEAQLSFQQCRKFVALDGIF